MYHRLIVMAGLWLALVGAAWAQPTATADVRETYMNRITAQQLRGHIFFLADDLLEGRETGERGQHLAGLYVRSQFMRMGLAPGNPQDSSYFQRFYLNVATVEGGTMTVGEQAFTYGEDFVNGSGGLLTNGTPELEFVGYALNRDGYDNLAQVDLEGKVALMLAGQPEEPGEDASRFALIRSWRERALALEERGAEGVIMVMPKDFFKIMKRYARPRSTSIGAAPEPSMPVVLTSPEMGQALLSAGKADYPSVLADLNEKAKLPRVKTQKIDLMVKAEVSFESKEASNVLGFLEGTERPEEVLVVTGHYDHVGINAKGEIHNGADDDASGTSTVMVVAEAFAQAAAAGHRPRRSILFMTVSGEEKGLLGSEFYADHPLYPIDKTVANLNIDMVGRTDPKYSEREDSTQYVYLIGSDRLSTDLHRWSKAMNERYTQLTLDYTYNAEDDPNRYYYRSDHYNFAKKGIPVIFYFNGTHEDYHKPTDDPEKIRYEKAARIARLVFVTAWEVANQAEPPVVDVAAKD